MPKEETDAEDKAGYNQAARISEILAILRSTYISSKMRNDFPGALEACRAILDVIAGKVNEEKTKKINAEIYLIEDLFKKTEETYVHNGYRYFKNPKERKDMKRSIEKLYRRLEKTQDEYGYGMFSEEDVGL